MKKGCAILFLFLASLSYCQNATLLQNIDFRAKELKHSLNKTGDTLILESERIITKVTIFNSDFEKLTLVNHKAAKIPLTDFPNGRFVTEVKVHNKLIIITLICHKPLNKISNSIVTKTAEVLNDEETMIISQNTANGKKISTVDLEPPIKINPKKTVRFYWIVKHIDKGHSSSKKMRIGDQAVVNKMIAQHKIDLKTKAGKRNQLTIWEVYDTTKFLRFKRQNPNYKNVKKADCFNTTPFYKSGT